jgi:hypothetical protein
VPARPRGNKSRRGHGGARTCRCCFKCRVRRGVPTWRRRSPASTRRMRCLPTARCAHPAVSDCRAGAARRSVAYRYTSLRRMSDSIGGKPGRCRLRRAAVSFRSGQRWEDPRLVERPTCRWFLGYFGRWRARAIGGVAPAWRGLPSNRPSWRARSAATGPIPRLLSWHLSACWPDRRARGQKILPPRLRRRTCPGISRWSKFASRHNPRESSLRQIKLLGCVGSDSMAERHVAGGQRLIVSSIVPAGAPRVEAQEIVPCESCGAATDLRTRRAATCTSAVSTWFVPASPRHARPCPGHPRLGYKGRRGWPGQARP